jgi:hypothetical protein
MDATELDQLLAEARGDVPAEYAKLVGLSIAPWGTHAIVLLAMNEPPAIELEQVVCSRKPGGQWEAGMSGGGLSDVVYVDDVRARPIGDDVELPSDATSVVVRDRGEEHEVVVRDGYFVYAAWQKDPPGDGRTDPPKPEIVRVVRAGESRDSRLT